MTLGKVLKPLILWNKERYPICMQNLRSLRVVLAIAFAVNVTWGYMFAFTPSLVERLYGFPLLDDLHAYLSLSRGAIFFFLAVAALLAALKPHAFRVLTLLLLIAYFLLFLVDVIVLARGRMSIGHLLPEMAYFLLIGAALVRFSPLTREEMTVQKIEEAQEVRT